MTRLARWALALVVLLLADAASAQTMPPIGRRKHSAILLRDGSVLVFGGSNDVPTHTGVTERFVPWTGWKTVGSYVPQGANNEGAATLLSDGRVVFIAEGLRIYDPDNDSWTADDFSFPQPRRLGHTLTTLHDGRVLLTGGEQFGLDAGHPVVGTFNRDGGVRWDQVVSGEVSFALRTNHAAVLQQDGTVLLMGGTRPLDNGTPGVQLFGIFDPATDSLRDAGSGFSTSRSSFTATRRLTREIFVFGDLNNSSVAPLLVDSSYNPQLLTRPSAAMKSGHAAVLLPSGTVEAYGGIDTNQVDYTWTFGPESFASLASGPPLNAPRGYHSATVLMDGKVLIVGGQSPGDTRTWELRDPLGFNFQVQGANSPGLANSTVTPLPSGSFLVVGGETSSLGQAVARTTATGSIIPVSIPTFQGRVGHTATLITSDEVLILGGFSQDGNGVLDECWLIGILTASATVKRCPPMLGKRYQHSATLLADGKVLVAGGKDQNGAPQTSTMLFDPRSGGGTWKPGPNLRQARAAHAAVMEPDGEVALIGGTPNPTTAEWYQVSGTTRQGPSLNFGRVGLSATLLRDGRILVTGGSSGDGGVWNTAEVYLPGAPGSDAWDFVGTAPSQVMGEPRAFHSAVAMPTGEVVIAGGALGTGLKADRWSPLTGRFDLPAGLSKARKSPAVVLSNRGEVVVFGGTNSSTEKPELFRYFAAPDAGGLDHGLSGSEYELLPGIPFTLRLRDGWQRGGEASGSNMHNSSVAMPRLVLQRVENGEVEVPKYDFDPDAGTFTVRTTALNQGHWRAWAYVSGFPGSAAWFRVGDAITLAWDAGIPDAGTDAGVATDGGSDAGSDGGESDGGTDAGLPTDGFAASIALDSADPRYTLVKVGATVRIAAGTDTPASELVTTISGSADLAICIDTDCAVGNVLSLTVPGMVGPTGVTFPEFQVRPMKDSEAHTVSVVLSRTGVGKVAGARATFSSITADDSRLTPGGCGCGQAPFGGLAVWVLAWALRKVRPKARQRL
jgi:hypothetical protein